MTVKDYIDSVRIEAAKAALRSSDDKLAVVAERVGFRDPNHFSAFFKTHTGLTPREYRTRSEP
jgi:two-component system response regulator YesN